MDLLNGGFEDCDYGVKNGGEPFICFNIGLGRDLITSYSQLKKDYSVFRTKNDTTYIFRKNTTIEEFLDYIGIREYDMERVMKKTEKTEITFYDLFNGDCIVSYGDRDSSENQEKARKWFYRMMFNETPRDKISWLIYDKTEQFILGLTS